MASSWTGAVRPSRLGALVAGRSTDGCLLLLHACAGGNRILPVIPQLIIPIKTALNTRDPAVICRWAVLLLTDSVTESM